MLASKRPISSSKQHNSPHPTQDILEGYSIDPSVGPTYAYQRSLPHLPVPPLHSTLSKYLETVQPHLTKEQYGRTKRVVEEFASSEIGRTLQGRLKLRANDTKNHPNWLASWWNEAAYMGYRGTVSIIVAGWI